MFADPVNWDNERAYEPLTIVVYNGDCYTSKCFVPVGADITNGLYWVKSQDYNYQFDQLNQVVADLSKQVTAFAGDNKKFTELINNFSTEFATMQTEFNKWSVQFPAMNERLDAAEADIDDLQAADAETAKTIDGLKKTDSELAGRLDGHDTDIEGLRAKDVEQDGRLNAIEAKNVHYDSDIAALKAKDADQQTQLDTIKAKDTEQDTRLDGIDTKLKNHDATLAQNTADIAKNTKNIQDNAANIAENARELADHAEQLKDHNARLTAQQKEITDNSTAIERNTSDIAGLRSDLTEAEANIAQNADAISHIQAKDVQQDARLDALEQRATTAEGRLDGLDTKTDNTNTALSAEVDRAKAAELANGKLIAKNAKELADHATELADHETRITALEGDNTTNKQEIADIKAKNTQQDTAISGNTDAIAHINDSLTGYVKTETYTAGQAAQDTKINAAQAAADKANANIGNWEADHPGQTISECAASQENELTEHAGSIAKLETDKADKTDIPDVSGFVTQTTYDAGQAVQDERLDALENSTPHYATYADFFAGAPLMPFNCYMTNTLSTDHRTCNIVLKSGAELRTKLPAGVTIAETASTVEIILKVLYYAAEADGTFRAGYSSGTATGTVKRTNANRELSLTLTNDVTMFDITTETAFNQPVTIIGFRG
jgi:chromosome segregation ATPase